MSMAYRKYGTVSTGFLTGRGSSVAVGWCRLVLWRNFGREDHSSIPELCLTWVAIEICRFADMPKAFCTPFPYDNY